MGKTLEQLEAELGPRGQLLPRWEKRSSLRAWLMKRKNLTYDQVSKTSISDLTHMYNDENVLSKFVGTKPKDEATKTKEQAIKEAVNEALEQLTQISGKSPSLAGDDGEGSGGDEGGEGSGNEPVNTKDGLGAHVTEQDLAQAKSQMGDANYSGAEVVARKAVQQYHHSKQEDGLITLLAKQLDHKVEKRVKKKMETFQEDIVGIVNSKVDQAIKEFNKLDAGTTQSNVVVCKVEHGGQQETYTDLGVQHKHFPLAFKAIEARVNLALVGEPGSGKTHAPTAVAKALGLKLYSMSFCQTTTKTDLLGYKDANGHYHSTPFRQAYEHGGVFIGDEFDAGNPNVGVVMNSATANDFCYFPDQVEPVRRHKDFILVLCMNTYGTGGNRQMVGRNQLDATTLDRFATLDWNIDPALEFAILGIQTKQKKIMLGKGGIPDSINKWVERVQAVRSACNKLEIRHVVSPRATINGAKLFKHGVGQHWVEEMLIWKGLDAEQRKRIESHLETAAPAKSAEPSASSAATAQEIEE